MISGKSPPEAMGPGLSSAIVVTVAYPRSPRSSHSRVLRVPLRSLGNMMHVLHRQGAVVTHVGNNVSEDQPAAAEIESVSPGMEPDPSAEAAATEPAPSRRRARSKSNHGGDSN